MPRRLIAALAAILFAVPAAAADLTGAATAIDGDSIRLNGTELRLYGIDAPEWNQTCTSSAARDGAGGAAGAGGVTKEWPCGHQAAEALAAMLAGRDTKCRPMDADRYGRVVAICKSGQLDLGQELVRRGLAVAYRRYSMRYAKDEDDARAAKRGIWAGAFQMPEDYRRTHPRHAAPPAP